MDKTDLKLGEDVSRELAWDSRLTNSPISIEVEQGVVILVGTVGSWALRLAAQEAVQRVAGVLEVENRLQVMPASDAHRSDAELTQAVQRALDWDAFIPKQRVRATVSDGQLILEGEVDYCYQREDVERAVRNTVGVRRVLNRIQVKPTHTTPLQIQRAIEAALERRSGRAVQRINLDVHEGKVILSGAVNSWAERQLVIGAAKGTLGVRSVDDRLRIEPDTSLSAAMEPSPER